MKKHLILLIIPLLFFSTGCEEDDIVNVEESQLDSNLFGNWYNPSGPGGFNYTMTLSSNGNFVWDVNYSSGQDWSSTSGIWWVEGNYLVLSGNSFGKSSPYVVLGDTLQYDGDTWTKQN